MRDKAKQWLQSRGITDETIEAFGIQTKGDWVGFPFADQFADVRLTKWRKIDKSDMRIEWPEESEKSLIAFGVHELNGLSELVVTEGEIDAMVVWQDAVGDIPVRDVISVPNGAPNRPGEGDIDPLDDGRFSWMWDEAGKLKECFDHYDRIVLMTDGDHPGSILADELAIRFGRHRCHLVEYPRGTKDANDVHLEYGADKVLEMIHTAKPIVPPRLVSFADIADSMAPAGLSSGVAALDENLLLTFPELVTVTGVPGAGKSQWVLYYVCQLARIHGIKTALLQLEDNPMRNKHDIGNYARAWKLDRDEFLSRHFMCLVPDHERSEDEDMTLTWLHETIREAACVHGCKVIVLDPWNEIEHQFGRSMTETQYTNEALRKMKKWARQYHIAIIVVAHPTKGVVEKSIGDLSMYDVAGSASWANKSDHGIIIYREEYSQETQIKVAKCKDHSRMGKPGVVTMKFNHTTSTFEFIRSGI